jgi:hypothetical protein
VIPDIKTRLIKVIDDPHFGNREKLMAKSSLRRIRELEREMTTRWTSAANKALLADTKKKLIDDRVASEIAEFLKRHNKQN